MADKAHLQTDLKLEQMEKRLSAIYSASYKKIQTKMLKFARNIDSKASELLDAIKQAETENEQKNAKNAYIRYFQKEVVKSKAFKDLSKEIALDLFDTNSEASAYINSQTPEIYALNYNWINEQLAKDIPDFVSQQITSKEADEYGDLTKQTVSRAKDTKWNEGNIKKSVIVGASLLLGANVIMKRSAKLTVEKNRNSANMHNSGMGTDAENKARLDGMYRAEDMGNEMTKIWIATLDNRTRDSHAMLDGASVPLDSVFDNGLERPRDPNGEPAEICNCRCSLKYGVGQTMGKTRSARYGDVSGSYKKSSSFKNTQSEEIANMSYGEWMKWRKTR
jgi:hypothetical protein